MSATLQPLVMPRGRNSVAEAKGKPRLMSVPRYFNYTCIIIARVKSRRSAPARRELVTYPFGSLRVPRSLTRMARDKGIGQPEGRHIWSITILGLIDH